MPQIQLPNGAQATIKDRAELTEREDRQISRALMEAAAAAGKMADYDQTNISTWGAYASLTDEEKDALDGFQTVLIKVFVKQYELPDDLLDLPKPVFDAMAAAAYEEYGNVPQFDVDAVMDPKAQPAD